MTDKYFTIILVVLVLAIVILIALVGLMIFFFFKFQKQQSLTNNVQTNVTPIAKKSLPETRMCSVHPDLAAATSCAVCDEYFCSNCLRQHENLYFCSPHLHLFLEGQWKEYDSIQTSASDPENGVRYYELKRKLWRDQNIPMVILTHYKIDVDTDTINTFLKVLVRENDMKYVKKESAHEGRIH